MRNITLLIGAALDKNLQADIALSTDTVSMWRGAAYSSRTGWEHYHIVHCDEAMRGGIVEIGSGSDGRTHWTDADTPGDVLARYLDDDMRP